MTIKEVLIKIEQYIQNNIYNINCGGCAWVTYYIYKECNKRGISIELVLDEPIFNKDDIDSGYYRNALDSAFSNYYLTASHVFLRYGDYTFNPMFSAFYYVYNKQSDVDLVIRRLRKSLLCRKYTLWNTEYDKKQNNKLRRAVAYYFSELD